jgi:hypothetical protein
LFEDIDRHMHSKNLAVVAALAAMFVITPFALLTQDTMANPCSRTDNGEDKTVSDEGARGANTEGNINCTFEDDVITFEPNTPTSPSGITNTESASGPAGPLSEQGPTDTTQPVDTTGLGTQSSTNPQELIAIPIVTGQELIINTPLELLTSNQQQLTNLQGSSKPVVVGSLSQEQLASLQNLIQNFNGATEATEAAIMDLFNIQ